MDFWRSFKDAARYGNLLATVGIADYNGEVQEGLSLSQTNAVDHQRNTSFKAYIEPYSLTQLSEQMGKDKGFVWHLNGKSEYRQRWVFIK